MLGRRNHADDFARRIREITGDGEEIFRVMVAIMRDDDALASDRKDAAKWLADRGWGKSPIVVQHDHVHVAPQLDLASCSIAELRALEATMSKLLPAGAPPVIDVPSTEGEP